jgi:hypothetical protein
MYEGHASSTMAGPGTTGARGRGRAAPSPRRCLSCSQWFDSAGAGERICPMCKAGEDWADAMAACRGYIAW